MRLWKRASGALKDNTSIFTASLTRRSAHRNPDIEAAIIKATSHDESYIDYRHTQCVFSWIRVSDIYLRPVLWAVSNRMTRTQNWVVALKGLMLMHGVFCCKVPAVQRIGRLPFDLSNFKDGHSRKVKTWSFEAFIQVYYAFLDQKSSFVFLHLQEQTKEQKIKKKQIHQDLLWLQKLQCLLDMLLQIKPRSAARTNMLVLEAMDCVVIESFDIYSRICNGIACILVRIYSAGITEAKMTLSILEKATVQGKELSQYFEFCRGIGVVNACECPKVEQISVADIQELKNLISASDQSEDDELLPTEEKKSVIMEEKTATTRECNDPTGSLKTIITNDWEVFEEDKKKPDEELDLISLNSPMRKNDVETNPFVQCNKDELPDLISF